MKNYITILLITAACNIAAAESTSQLLRVVATYDILEKHAKSNSLTKEQQAQSLIAGLTYNTTTKQFEPVGQQAIVLKALKELNLSSSTTLEVKKTNSSSAFIAIKNIISMLEPKSTPEPSTPNYQGFDDEEYDTEPTPAEEAQQTVQVLVNEWRFSSKTHFFKVQLDTQKTVLMIMQSTDDLENDATIEFKIDDTTATKTMTIEQIKNTIQNYEAFQEAAAKKMAEKWKAVVDQKKQAQLIAGTLQWTADPTPHFINAIDILQVAMESLQAIGNESAEVTLGSSQSMTVAALIKELNSAIVKNKAAIKIQATVRKKQAEKVAAQLRIIKNLQIAVNALVWDNGVFTNPLAIQFVVQQTLQQAVTENVSSSTLFDIAGNEEQMSIEEIIETIQSASDSHDAQVAAAEKIAANIILSSSGDRLNAKDGSSLAEIVAQLAMFPADLTIAVPTADLSGSTIKDIIEAILTSAQLHAEPMTSALLLQGPANEAEQYFTIKNGANTQLEILLGALKELQLPGDTEIKIDRNDSTDTLSLQTLLRILQKQVTDRKLAALKIQAKWKQVSTRNSTMQEIFQNAVENLSFDEDRNQFSQTPDELLLAEQELMQIAKFFGNDDLKVTISGKEFAVKEIINKIKVQVKQHEEATEAAQIIQRVWRGHKGRSQAQQRSNEVAQEAVVNLVWNNETATFKNDMPQLQRAQAELERRIKVGNIKATAPVKIQIFGSEASHQMTVQDVLDQIKKINNLNQQAQQAVEKLTLQGSSFTQLLTTITPIMSQLNDLIEQGVDRSLELTVRQSVTDPSMTPTTTMTVQQVVETIASTIIQARIRGTGVRSDNSPKITAAKAMSDANKAAQVAVDDLTLHGTIFAQSLSDQKIIAEQLKNLIQTASPTYQLTINNDMHGGGGMAPTTKMTIQQVLDMIQKAQDAADKDAATDPKSLTGYGILTALAQRGDVPAYPTSVYTEQVVTDLWKKYLNTIATKTTSKISFTKPSPDTMLQAAISKTKASRTWEDAIVAIKQKNLSLYACFDALQKGTPIDIRTQKTAEQILAYTKTGDILTALYYAGNEKDQDPKYIYPTLTTDQQKALWQKYFDAVTKVAIADRTKLTFHIDATQQDKLNRTIDISKLSRREILTISGRPTDLGACFALAEKNTTQLQLTSATQANDIIRIIQNANQFAAAGPYALTALNIFKAAFKFYMNTFGWVHATSWDFYISRRTHPASNTGSPLMEENFKKAVEATPETWQEENITLNVYTNDAGATTPYSTPQYTKSISFWISKLK